MGKIKYFLTILLLITLVNGYAGSNKSKLSYRINQISDRDLTGAATRWEKTNGTLLIPSTNSQILNGEVTELKVLAIRVEFVEDKRTTTTGTGKFDLSQPKEIVIDPPPHNRTYFEAQLLAAANYFKRVSKGKLLLKGVDSPVGGDIFPRELNKAYQLPQEMAYYGTDDNSLRDKRLAELFRDALLSAEQSDQINFSAYNCCVVFHAGVGGDFAFDFDETLFDIPSAFLSFTDLKEHLSNNDAAYKGIPVQNGNHFIRDGIILPETQNQNDLEFGLLGTTVLMFGAQIGLPNLFNTETGRSGIGKWGLMDQGSGNYKGLIPAQPCAWSKIFMGWETPIVINSGQNIPVAATLADDPHKIYKVPINAHEYFLIENRQQHILKNPDLAVGFDQNGIRVEFSRSGTITQQAGSDSFKVIVSVDEYDFDCPGSGILIWHIDEKVITENYKTNRINADPNRRGVDLEEAHGSQDIGGSYGFLHPASGSETGLSENAFWNDNQSNLTVNNATAVAFTPNSNPGSWSNERGNSHIILRNFSKIQPVMTFDLTSDWFQSGFPRAIGNITQLTPQSLLVFDLNNDGTKEILASSQDGAIYVWKNDGSKFIQNDYQIIKPDFAGRVDSISVALFAKIQDSILVAPGVADINGDGIFEIFVASNTGQIYAWESFDQDQDGQADLMTGFPLQLNHRITTPPLSFASLTGKNFILWGLDNGEIVALDPNGVTWRNQVVQGAIQGLAFEPNAQNIGVTGTSGEIALLKSTGELLWKSSSRVGSKAGQPVIGKSDKVGTEMIVPFIGGKIVIFALTGEILREFQIPAENNLPELILSDLNSDGRLEILSILDDQLFAYSSNGVLFENFPIKIIWSTEKSGFQYTTPIACEINQDQAVEVFWGAPDGLLSAYDSQGQIVPGFPVSMGAPLAISPAIGQFDNDKDIELISISNDNSLYVWNLNGLSVTEPSNFWTGYLAGAQHWAYATTTDQTAAEEKELISLAYNYPNPTEGDFTTIRYHLGQAGQVSIQIYDLAGALIETLNGTGLAAVPNEVIWNLKNIQSGIYFAKIQVTDTEDGNESFKFIKIAVVK
ncbi:VCBS repeat-containing protein [candidate division KSB1 bacterium]|nr:VCBS repeat-containing protein [candidate division KSB1 bacterium]